jgi:hypothetical protein
MAGQFRNTPPGSSSSPAKSPTPLLDTQLRNDLMIQELHQQVKALQHQVDFLSRCCGLLFDNDQRLATWVYCAHPILYKDTPPQFVRLKAYPNYPLPLSYPFQPMEVYGCMWAPAIQQKKGTLSMTRQFAAVPPSSDPTRSPSPPKDFQVQHSLLLEELRARVKALEKEVIYLRRCCRQLFDNDGILTSWAYYAHDAIYGMAGFNPTGHPWATQLYLTPQSDIPYTTCVRCQK